MPEVLDWQRDGPAEVMARAAQYLRQGLLVVIPTDSVYAVLAHGLESAAVQQLGELVRQTPVIGLADPLEVTDWLPNLDGLARRLARHCWPGPLALRSGAGAEAGLVRRLPAPVQATLLSDGQLTLRVSGHPLLGQLIPQVHGPVVVAELAKAKEPADALAAVGDRVALVVQDGPAYFGQPASVVQVAGRSWNIVNEGVLGPDHLAELAVCRILFVCTGNTCRSPLAVALCRHMLAQRLQCSEAELPAHGFDVLSAGLAAIMGEPASPEAVDIARELGGNLEAHRSQPISAELLARADCLFTMTNMHQRLLQSLKLEAGPTPRMLAPDGADVVDPISCDIAVYRDCARKIADYLEQRLPEILEM